MPQRAQQRDPQHAAFALALRDERERGWERVTGCVFVCALLLFISSQQAHTQRAASSENETAVCVFAEPLCAAFVSYIADAAAFLIKPPQICIFNVWWTCDQNMLSSRYRAAAASVSSLLLKIVQVLLETFRYRVFQELNFCSEKYLCLGTKNQLECTCRVCQPT